jgi:hypothetical protein
MQKSITEYYKLPENYLTFNISEQDDGRDRFFHLNKILCFGKSAAHETASVITGDNCISLSTDLNSIIDNLRLERYAASENRIFYKSFYIEFYYKIRPYLPDYFRHKLQKFSMRKWKKISFPHFPVDTTVEDIFESIIVQLLKYNNNKPIPFIWFWPEGKKGCLLMTHDIEEEAGLNFCPEMMDIDSSFDIKSSFQAVPEKRYKITAEDVKAFSVRGFEVLLHGLNHDGKLFSNKEIFLERIKKIHRYAERWKVNGFRSPIMYRNLDWYEYFNFKYDMSVPNNANIEPQKGGCCTVMPYKIANLLEIPLTTMQDHPLYYYLKDHTVSLWQRQVDIILKKYGLLSFSIHPDYTIPAKAKENYKRLLSYLAELRETSNLWNALPAEIYEWWTARNLMLLVNKNGKWEIEGDNTGKARIAYMKLENGNLVFTVE